MQKNLLRSAQKCFQTVLNADMDVSSHWNINTSWTARAVAMATRWTTCSANKSVARDCRRIAVYQRDSMFSAHHINRCWKLFSVGLSCGSPAKDRLLESIVLFSGGASLES